MSNPLVFGTLIELTFVTNLSYTVFLKTPIYTTLLCYLNQQGQFLVYLYLFYLL